MVLESNDPLEPLTEISFTGVAVDPDGEDAEEEGGGAGGEAKPVTISSEVGCGCGTTGAPAWPGMLAFAAGGLVMVRRRREE
jgi:MYXO-CTERM domain-containing protein